MSTSAAADRVQGSTSWPRDAVNVRGRDTEGVEPSMPDDLTSRADAPRKPISKRLRYEILRRDDHTCRYCGGQAPDVKLTIDHVVPVTLGGTDEPTNLVTACRDCNAGKSSVAPDAQTVSDVEADALRWAAAMKRAAEIQAASGLALRDYRERFAAEWGTYYSLPSDWTRTVDRWFKDGVEIDVLVEAVDAAMRPSGIDYRWAYFCGVMRSKLTERAEIARDLIDRGDVA